MYRPPSIDEQHLQILSILHFVLGGLQVLFGCLPIVYLVLGIAMISGNMATPQDPGPPAALGWFLIIGAIIAITLTWAFALCLILAGQFLRRRRRRLFCLVSAGIACAHVPLGTVLGVFTFLVLLRPSVKELYEEAVNPPLQARPAHTEEADEPQPGSTEFKEKP